MADILHSTSGGCGPPKPTIRLTSYDILSNVQRVPLSQPHRHIRGIIVVSISACHAEDPGSTPGRGISLIDDHDDNYQNVHICGPNPDPRPLPPPFPTSPPPESPPEVRGKKQIIEG